MAQMTTHEPSTSRLRSVVVAAVKPQSKLRSQ
jgi:hypothetical protein